MIAIHIVVFLLLIVLTVQDFKTRTISWVLIPSIFFILCIGKKIETSDVFFLKDILLNVIILLIILFGTFIYFLARYKITTKSFFEIYLGIGDILFLLAITPYFRPFNFLAFLLLSQMFILLVYSGVYLLKGKIRNIPFAGLLGMLLCCLMVVDIVNPDFKTALYGYINF